MEYIVHIYYFIYYEINIFHNIWNVIHTKKVISKLIIKNSIQEDNDSR